MNIHFFFMIAYRIGNEKTQVKLFRLMRDGKATPTAKQLFAEAGIRSPGRGGEGMVGRRRGRSITVAGRFMFPHPSEFALTFPPCKRVNQSGVRSVRWI
jgi:hypothetical protein